jgi:hypothetical protein
VETYSLTHLSNHALQHDLIAVVAKDCSSTAWVLAHIAEFDARKLYLPAGFPSMYLYCVHKLRFCEQAAYRRIQAARAARRFPAIFAAVADGRLHLSAVVMLAPHLLEDTADELLAAATHKTKSEIERLLAARFPRPDVPTLVRAVAPPSSLGLATELAPGRVEEQWQPATESAEATEQSPPATVGALPFTGAQVEPPVPRARVKPLSPQRYAMQVTIGQGTHDKLRYAQELLRHQVPAGDVAEVLDRALDALIQRLEQRKFAATTRPRPRHSATGGRYVPAHVKRAVWKRDQGQCTFVGETGHRCPARGFLEFDHIDEVARGGEATVDRMRLRCRAHNQYGAECTFGTEFMNDKRQEARRAAAEARAPGAGGPCVNN